MRGHVTRQRYLQMTTLFLKRRIEARDSIYFAQRVHRYLQAHAAGKTIVCIHEQPQRARMAVRSKPADALDDVVWPSALGDCKYADVASCRVGYVGMEKGRRLGKCWRFEVFGNEKLLRVLQSMECRCGRKHDESCTDSTALTSKYNYKLGLIIATGGMIT